MQHHKSAEQLQAEIRLIRLAYRERQERHERLNRFLAEDHCPIWLPYVLSLGIVLTAIFTLGRHFL